MELAELILNSREYLSCFDYDHYPACFQAFEEAFAPLADALGSLGPEQAAEALTEELARRRAALPRRQQKTAAEEEKQVLALFLSPAAARLGGFSLCFSEALMRRWNALYPRNTYLAGDYETILKGFDANLLGIPLRKSKRRR